MKHKNVRLICAAAALCMASVLLLIGCMGSSAEKTGTKELVPAGMESEASDMLADVLNEASEGDTAASADSGEDAAVDQDIPSALQDGAAAQAGGKGALGETEGSSNIPEALQQGSVIADGALSGSMEVLEGGTQGLLSGKTEGSRTEEELKAIWQKMYEKYVSSDWYDKAGEQGMRIVYDPEAGTYRYPDEESPDLVALDETTDTIKLTMDDAMMDAAEAGLIALKEIDRLHPNTDLDNFFLYGLHLTVIEMGEGRPARAKWSGYMENAYAHSHKNFISYNYEIDAITGEIVEFRRFHPYDREKDYTGIAWTDDEILERAKELIGTYHLAEEGVLDWSTVEIDNSTEDIGSVQKDIEYVDKVYGPNSISVENSVIFFKNGREQFHLQIDFAAGDISVYYWSM